MAITHTFFFLEAEALLAASRSNVTKIVEFSYMFRHYDGGAMSLSIKCRFWFSPEGRADRYRNTSEDSNLSYSVSEGTIISEL